MHLPQIVADLKYRRKIAENGFCENPRAFDQRILREKNDMTFSVDPNWTLQILSWTLDTDVGNKRIISRYRQHEILCCDCAKSEIADFDKCFCYFLHLYPMRHPVA